MDKAEREMIAFQSHGQDAKLHKWNAERIKELETAIQYFREEYASGKYNAAAQELFKTLEESDA